MHGMRPLYIATIGTTMPSKTAAITARPDALTADADDPSSPSPSVLSPASCTPLRLGFCSSSPSHDVVPTSWPLYGKSEPYLSVHWMNASLMSSVAPERARACQMSLLMEGDGQRAQTLTHLA